MITLLATYSPEYSIEYRQNSYLSSICTDNSPVCTQDTLSIAYYSSIISKNDKLTLSISQLNKFLADKSISANVYNNAYQILSRFSQLILDKIDMENIYCSEYGTLLIDFEMGKENIFSLEVGKDSVGYFSEINCSNFQFCEQLKTLDDENNHINSKTITDEIELFYNQLNQVDCEC